jgi:hypothetical protein
MIEGIENNDSRVGGGRLDLNSRSRFFLSFYFNGNKMWFITKKDIVAQSNQEDIG